MVKKAGSLTLSTSQTLTVLSPEDVAIFNVLGLKQTSVIHCECSSSVNLAVKDFVHHTVACTIKLFRNVLETKTCILILIK